MEKKYILSELFTIIPAEHYTPQQGKAALQEQFALQGEYVYGRYDFPKANAVVAYAVPQEEADKNGTEGEIPYPLVVRMLEEAILIPHFNKVVFHYSTAKKISHIVIATGDGLKLANSFKADSFESALYFLFLSIQQLQMNPRQCIVRVCSETTQQQEETFARFFNGIEKDNLEDIIHK